MSTGDTPPGLMRVRDVAPKDEDVGSGRCGPLLPSMNALGSDHSGESIVRRAAVIKAESGALRPREASI